MRLRLGTQFLDFRSFAITGPDAWNELQLIYF